MAFRARKVFGTFEKRAPGFLNVSPRDSFHPDDHIPSSCATPGLKSFSMLLSNIFSAQVVSNENENLTITAEKKISVEGHEGVFFDGKMLRFDVQQDVNLSSTLVRKID